MPSIEEYVIQGQDQFEMLTCAKRKLEIQIIHTDKVPESLPPEALIVFGIFRTLKEGGVLDVTQTLISAFCILNPEKIQYEKYFRHDLILNAVNYWSMHEMGHRFDEISYSPGYTSTFIDSRSLDPKDMSAELIGYCSRDISEEPLDFYEWREKHLAALLN